MPPMNVAIWNLKVKCNTLHINTPQKKILSYKYNEMHAVYICG